MAGEDKLYADFIRRQPCCKCGRRPPSEIHHRTGAGLSLRAPDRLGIPLCSGCHRDFHDCRGEFRGMCRLQRREFQDSVIAEMQARFDCF